MTLFLNARLSVYTSQSLQCLYYLICGISDLLLCKLKTTAPTYTDYYLDGVSHAALVLFNLWHE